MKASELKAGDWFETTTRRGKWRGLCVDPADECNETLAYLRGYSHVLQRLSEDEVTPLPDCTGWDWQPQQSYAARQAAWVEANGIEVGSRVRVNQHGEVGRDWDSSYSRLYHGREGEVEAICEDMGVTVSFGGDSVVFPFTVLEPVEPAPQPPLQVREGKWYLSRDGKVGKARLHSEVESHKWVVGVRFYNDIGERWDDAHNGGTDLIAEVPPPSESPVMETPDKVDIEYVFDETGDMRVRRITPEPEREATYRAFAGAEEFRPHRDRWIRNPSSSSVRQVEHYSDTHCNGIPYGMLVRNRVWDDDGTPCGVREAGDAVE